MWLFVVIGVEVFTLYFVVVLLYLLLSLVGVFVIVDVIVGLFVP